MLQLSLVGPFSGNTARWPGVAMLGLGGEPRLASARTGSCRVWRWRMLRTGSSICDETVRETGWATVVCCRAAQGPCAMGAVCALMSPDCFWLLGGRWSVAVLVQV